MSVLKRLWPHLWCCVPLPHKSSAESDSVLPPLVPRRDSRAPVPYAMANVPHEPELSDEQVLRRIFMQSPKHTPMRTNLSTRPSRSSIEVNFNFSSGVATMNRSLTKRRTSVEMIANYVKQKLSNSRLSKSSSKSSQNEGQGQLRPAATVVADAAATHPTAFLSVSQKSTGLSELCRDLDSDATSILTPRLANDTITPQQTSMNVHDLAENTELRLDPAVTRQNTRCSTYELPLIPCSTTIMTPTFTTPSQIPGSSSRGLTSDSMGLAASPVIHTQCNGNSLVFAPEREETHSYLLPPFSSTLCSKFQTSPPTCTLCVSVPRSASQLSADGPGDTLNTRAVEDWRFSHCNARVRLEHNRLPSDPQTRRLFESDISATNTAWKLPKCSSRNITFRREQDTANLHPVDTAQRSVNSIRSVSCPRSANLKNVNSLAVSGRAISNPSSLSGRQYTNACVMENSLEETRRQILRHEPGEAIKLDHASQIITPARTRITEQNQVNGAHTDNSVPTLQSRNNEPPSKLAMPDAIVVTESDGVKTLPDIGLKTEEDLHDSDGHRTSGSCKNFDSASENTAEVRLNLNRLAINLQKDADYQGQPGIHPCRLPLYMQRKAIDCCHQLKSSSTHRQCRKPRSDSLLHPKGRSLVALRRRASLDTSNVTKSPRNKHARNYLGSFGMSTCSFIGRPVFNVTISSPNPENIVEDRLVEENAVKAISTSHERPWKQTLGLWGSFSRQFRAQRNGPARAHDHVKIQDFALLGSEEELPWAELVSEQQGYASSSLPVQMREYTEQLKLQGTKTKQIRGGTEPLELPPSGQIRHMTKALGGTSRHNCSIRSSQWLRRNDRNDCKTVSATGALDHPELEHPIGHTVHPIMESSADMIFEHGAHQHPHIKSSNIECAPLEAADLSGAPRPRPSAEMLAMQYQEDIGSFPLMKSETSLWESITFENMQECEYQHDESSLNVQTETRS